ncbi:SMI1/KNR4 family protein [Actinomadura parmotrematis]|uniref:SMI1/KNR4 family protein n=1 Tax=Actinomadura parmotrematis TaxID=2864039 RepID=A0ABS7FZT3_9ACTN|nr:SMI1/KNR4 family protein [Actinomadura parmotrematis]MBW8485124.1 SMI1/KNR4 family protein [Actinomadura parmotrematis]
MSDDLALPGALAEVAAVGFEWEWDEETDEGRGVDFEVYERIEEPARTAWWFRLWTGNPEVDGAQFRFFGTTGAGDYVGFWLVRPGAALVEQPVVYIGSEGERDVIAKDLGDLLWVFAAGLGPAEVEEGGSAEPHAGFRAIAERYAPGRERSPEAIVAAAREEFPGFHEHIAALIR